MRKQLVLEFKSRAFNAHAVIGFLKYFAGAFAGLSCDWLTTFIILHYTGNPTLSQASGKASGAVLAFFIYRHAVFTGRVAESLQRESIRFIFASLVGWLTSVILFSLLLNVFSFLPSKIVSDGITFSLNWFVMKLFVFRNNGKVCTK